MKQFRFRFAPVLKVRRIERDQQSKVFAAALKDLNRVNQEIEDLHKAYDQEVLRMRSTASSSSMIDLNISMVSHYRDEIRRAILRKKKEREEITQRCEAERQKLVEKERRKKVLDKLEERDRENYEQSENKLEQAEMDETASGRWFRDS